MAKTVTLRVDEETYQTLSRRAAAESRSLANFIEVAALQYAQWSEFTTDDEMRTLQADRDLVRRLHAGSRHARLKRGRFVA